MKKTDLLKRIEALEAEVQRLKAYQAAPAPSVSPLQPYVPTWTEPRTIPTYPHFPYEVTCLGQH